MKEKFEKSRAERALAALTLKVVIAKGFQLFSLLELQS
jgi:hypothetical protein